MSTGNKALDIMTAFLFAAGVGVVGLCAYGVSEEIRCGRLENEASDAKCSALHSSDNDFIAPVIIPTMPAIVPSM